jgi:hypothetical protein
MGKIAVGTDFRTRNMRIPFPKTIPLGPMLITLTAVLLVQIIQGTDPAFAVLMLVAQLATAVAFNRMGGMTHMAGAFCLFAVLPNVTVPEITHMFLGQPGDYNLQHPVLTASVCAVFFICVMTAALLVSSVSHPFALLDRFDFSIAELRIISIISCIISVSVNIMVMMRPEAVENGSLLAALNHFAPMLLSVSVMLATFAQIVTTNGKSAVSWYVAFLLFISILPGLLNASKDQLLTPLLCWTLVAASSRHRFTWYGTVAMATILIVAWVFVYPFAQNARVELRSLPSMFDRIPVIIKYFRDPSQFPDSTANADESTEFGAATSRVNIIQRYSLLQTNDMLIDADLRSGYTSMDRYAPVLLSVIPHALWPDRPAYILSNELGHKAGFRMSDTDESTGISIGSPGMFFDVGGWLALIVYTLIFFTAFFFVAIRLVGSSDRSIWALVPIGTQALIAGAASPSSMFLLIVSFMGMFSVMIVILKTISYVAMTLISKPIPS